jgi:hypothetical protein
MSTSTPPRFTDPRANDIVRGWIVGNGTERIREKFPSFDPRCLQKAEKVIYECARSLELKGIHPDIITITQSLQDSGELSQVGGAEKIVPGHDIDEVVWSSIRSLEDLWQKAQAAKIGSKLTEGFITSEDAIKQLGEIPSASSLDDTETLFEDLGPYLEGEVQQEVPTIGKMWDGKSLFYAGRLNELHAEPSAGKTNVIMAAIRGELEQGRVVVYIDPEDKPLRCTNILRLFGVPDELILSGVKYLWNPTPQKIERAQAWTKKAKPSLVVIDGLAELMASEGSNENEALDVLQFFKSRLRPFQECGAAVVIADHVTKSSENRGQFARGSGAKAGRYDGVSYEVVSGVSYTPDKAGFIKLKIAKDRNGGAGARNQIICEIHFTPGAAGGTIVEFKEPNPEAARPTILMGKITEYLTDKRTANKTELRNLGNHDWIDKAIDLLLKDGLLNLEKSGASNLYSLKQKQES